MKARSYAWFLFSVCKQCTMYRFVMTLSHKQNMTFIRGGDCEK